jgi:RNA recognition motif-containing protein
MNLYVSNISFHTTESDLKNLFSRFGEVASATVVTDQGSGRTLGFGFVKMSDERAALEAMDALQGKEIEGRALSVSVAKANHRGPMNTGNAGKTGRLRRDSRLR